MRPQSPVPELKPTLQPDPEVEPATEPDPQPTMRADPTPSIRVHAPSRTPEHESEPVKTLPGEDDQPVRISSTMLMIALGVLIVIFAVVWAVAFQMGQQKRDNEIAQWQQPGEGSTPSPGGAGGTTPPPTPPSPAPVKPEGSGNQPKKPEPAKPAPTTDGLTDPRVPGFNYLYLGTLTLKDAAAGVDFLRRNSLQSFYLVDRSRVGGNNPPCRIYASQGFPGGPRFRETEKERNELVRRVEELGKKWQREEKGASDFRQPYWTLHKE